MSQDFYPSPKGSQEIAKNEVATVLLDTLYKDNIKCHFHDLQWTMILQLFSK